MKEYDRMRPYVNGHGQEIASKLGISYMKYRNILRGFTSDVALQEAILEACKEKLHEINSGISDILG